MGARRRDPAHRGPATGPRAAVAVLATFTLTILALVPGPASALTTVTIVSPLGGDVSGGTVRDVVWDLATDSNNDVDVEYLVDGVPTLIEQRTFLLPDRYTTPWSVPDQDLANVTIRVCAIDAIPIECDTSSPFSIDATEPEFTSRSPEGPNAFLGEPIDLYFSEVMNGTAVESAISIVPDPGNVTFTKPGGNGTRVLHAPFLPGQAYAVTLSCAATDQSDPGNAVVGCPVSWSFMAATPPSVAFDRPAGGERWTGGTSHEVRWIAADAEDPTPSLQVYLEASLDGGRWSALAGPLAGDAAYPWSVPRVDAPDARLRVRAVDTRALEATATSASFAIDSTAPTVAAVVPAPNEVGAAWADPILVRFAEAVVGSLDASAFGLRDAGGLWIRGSPSWDSPSEFRFTPDAPLRAFQRYTARVNATLWDTSDPGNAMAAPYEWTFVTRLNHGPEVTMLVGPEPRITGGSTWSLTWSASDPDDDPSELAVYVEFSDGGAFSTVAGPLPASFTFSWTAPEQDAPTAALLVRVVDSQGGAATDAILFAVDATPPTILAASPGPGATDVPPDAELVLVFSEPLTSSGFVGLRDAASAGWTGLTASWDDPVTLRLRPTALLREMSTYEVVVNGTARDASSPGNPLAPTVWTFQIASFPPALTVLEPAPNARWTAGAAQTIRVRAVDARDPVVAVAADFAPDAAGFLPFLAAVSLANGDSSLPVTAPAVDAPNARLRVCAADASGATTCVTVPLAIDATRPRLLQSAPAPGAKQVHPSSPIVLTFSERMDPAAVESSLSISPTTPFAFRWARTIVDTDTAFIDHPVLLGLRTYTVSLGCVARDASTPGLPLAGACPVAWSFTTAATPEVRLLFPVGGERLTGGIPHGIRWVSAEEEGVVRVAVDLSLDGGLTFPMPLVFWEPFAVGDTVSERPLPRVDTAEAVLRVTVQDSLGLTATTASAPFAIDATPPFLVSASPADGAVDVSPLEDFALVFSESMDPSSAYALAITPAPRNAVLVWTATNVPHDTLRIAHASIRLGSKVTVSLDGIRDASRPGNPATDRVAFTVLPDRERPRAAIAIDAEATAGEVVVLDATASSDNDEIVEYTWTVRDANELLVTRIRGDRVEYRAVRSGAFNVTVAVIDAAGNRGEASAPLRVHALGTATEAALPPSLSLLGWLALGGSGATAYGLTDRGRSFLTRMLVLPLYVRMKGPAVLNHETRGMIRGYILVHPGDCYTDIKRNLGLANGEVAYHLGVLEREGIVRAVAKGPKRVYYPADMRIPEDGGGVHEIQRRLLKTVEEVPGMTLHDVAGLLGVSAQLALYHARKLGERGLVRLERHGMKLRVVPTSPAERQEHREGSRDT